MTMTTTAASPSNFTWAAGAGAAYAATVAAPHRSAVAREMHRLPAAVARVSVEYNRAIIGRMPAPGTARAHREREVISGVALSGSAHHDDVNTPATTVALLPHTLVLVGTVAGQYSPAPTPVAPWSSRPQCIVFGTMQQSYRKVSYCHIGGKNFYSFSSPEIS
eukprot:IDg20169t1